MKFLLKNPRLKTTLLLFFGVPIVLYFFWTSGHLVLAYQDQKRAHVFPTEVTAVGWDNTQSALTRDLSSLAAPGSFSTGNSAYIELPASASTPASADTTESTVDTTPPSVVPPAATSSPDPTSAPTPTSPTPDSVPAPDTTTTVSVPSDTPSDTTPSGTILDTPAASDTTDLPVASSTPDDSAPITLPLPDITPTSTDDTATTTTSMLNRVAPQLKGFATSVLSDVVTFAYATTLGDTPDDLSTTTSTPATSTITDATPEDTSAASSTSPTPVSTPSNSDVQAPAPSAPATDPSVDVPRCTVLGTPCHTIELSGFNVGGSLTNKRLRGVELNFSFANISSETAVDGKLMVRYFHNGEWHSAGEIYLNKPLSNGTNGGYFKQVLSDMSSWSDFSDVKVVVEYERGDDSAPAEVYLDAVWLDAIYSDQIQDTLSGNVAPPTDAPSNVSFDLVDNEQPDNTVVLDDGTKLSFPYLNTLSDTLAIRANQSAYAGSGTTTVAYVSITDTGTSPDTFTLSNAFPGGKGTLFDISEYLQDVPTSTSTTQTSDVTYFCEAGWLAASSSDGTPTGQDSCAASGESYACSALSDAATNCLVPDVTVSTATSTSYVSAWVPLSFSNPSSPDAKVTKILPPGYQVTAATDHTISILPGQTLYFRVTMKTPDSQSERFVLAASGANYFGSLNSLRLRSEEYLKAAANIHKAVSRDSINEQLSEDSDFGADQTPTFKFKFKTQRAFFTQLFDALIGKPDKYTVQGAQLEHDTGEIEHLPVDIQYGSSNQWTIQLDRQGRDFRPGKYSLGLSMNEGGTSYSDSVSFYWGVLALNADKSSYEPGDNAHLTIAALNDQGDTMCDAQLALTVTDPSGNASDVPVVSGGGCGDNNVTDLPDFIADYPVSEEGTYTLKLARLDDSGNIVTSINDTITVASDTPYVITRSGPTRIYPTSAYQMQLGVSAANGYSGNVVEAVPEGFTIADAGGAKLTHADGVIYLTWDASIASSGPQYFNYTFKAPDVSPYIYMLGPATMTDESGLEFTEPRTWKIASDAVAIATGVAWLNGNQTTNGANLDTASAFPLTWNLSNSFDTTFYSYSTSTNPSRLTVNVGGDYLVAVTVPIERADTTGDSTSLEADVRVNGVKKNIGVSRAFIKTTSGVSQSSNHLYVLLRNLNAGDYIESDVHQLSTATDTISIGTQASLYAEYIGNDQSVYFGLGTTTLAGTNLNPAATSTLVWYDDSTLGRSDANYTHSNATAADTVTLGAAGSYFVLINVPLNGSVTSASPIGRVLLNGSMISGGEFKQGYIAATAGIQDSSMQWSGVVTATTSNETLNVSLVAGGASGTLTASTNVASMYVQSLPSSGIYLGAATTTSSGTSWNPASAANVLWQSDQLIDTGVYSHSTSANSYQVTVSQAGDYLLALNDSHAGTIANSNQITSVSVGGVALSGAQTRTHYIPTAVASLFSNGYSYMRTITVGANASSTQTNFPMLVSGTYSYLAATSSGGLVNNTAGNDIIFTSDAAGTSPLSWEQESYNKNNGAVSYWVNVPSISSSTVIYMFYGNPSVSTFQGNVKGTWNSNFKLVNHFSSTSTISTTDSTSNGFNGTNSGGTAGTGIVGIGGDGNFTGTSLMTFATTSSLTGTFTVETWAETQTAAGINDMFGSRSPSDQSFDVKFNNGNLIHGDVGNGTAWTNTAADKSFTYSTNTWYHVVYEVNATNYTVYVNGTSLGTGTAGAGIVLYDSTHTLTIANEGAAGGENLNGSMDEVRVMTNNPSSSWVLTDYNSQHSPSTFYTVGSQQTATAISDAQSSGSLVYLLRNLAASSTISVTTVANGTTGTITEDRNALFMLWHKSAQSNFVQNTERWYAASNAQTPTDPWPSGGVDLNQGDTVTTGNALLSGNPIRMRIGLTATVNTLAGTDSFKLQYAPGSICSLALSWSDVGTPSSGSIWRGYNSTSATPGSTLGSVLLTTSSTTETYEDQNPSAVTPNGLTVGTDGEWDWSIQDNGATPGTNYCFRMVQSSGQLLKNYTTYPQVITNASPVAPTLTTPFDNAALSATNPPLSFLTYDTNGDTLHYNVQVSTDPNFGSLLINDDTISNYAKFTDIINPSQRAPYVSGQPIQYIPTATLSNGTTYWWRVRAIDPSGSNTYSSFSSAQSFTVKTAASVPTWLQTTADQFSEDTLFQVATSGTDDVRLAGANTSGTITSAPITYSSASSVAAWGKFSWTNTQTGGQILYQVQYLTSTSSWALIPNSALAGNATGTTTSPINLSGLNTTTYGTIRLVGNYTFTSATPILSDWTVTWSLPNAQPTPQSPFESAALGTTLPTLEFLSSNPLGNDLTYEVQIDPTYVFSAPVIDATSSISAGFSSLASSTDSDPFASGSSVIYTVQNASILTSGTTYWWRVRSTDPIGSNVYSSWSTPQSFTVNTSIVNPTWYQATNSQFSNPDALERAGYWTTGVTGTTTTGEIAVYQASSANEAITTSAFTNGWATTARQDAVFSLTGTTTIGLSKGHYAVIYNDQFSTAAGTSRAEIQSGLVLGGTSLPAGWSQGIIRNNAGANEAFTEGGAIINAPTNGTTLQLQSFRTDTNPSVAVARVAGTSGIELIKLDDAWNYIRLSRQSSMPGPVSNSWMPVTYDRIDELSSSAFTYNSGDNTVTIANPGHYLVFANTYGATTMNNESTIDQELTLNGSPIEGSFSTVYMRGNANGDGDYQGAAAIGMIIQTTSSNATLGVQVEHSLGTAQWTIDANQTGAYVDRSGLTIVQLTNADFIQLQESANDNMNPTSLTPINWSTEIEKDTASFAHSTVTNTSRITASVSGDYLFMGSLYAAPGTTANTEFTQEWRENGSTLISYGQTGGYNSLATGDVGNWSAAVFPGLSGSNYFEMVALAGASTTGSVPAVHKAAEAVRINTLSTADTNPIQVQSSSVSLGASGLGPQWGSFSWNATTPTSTVLTMQVYYLSTSSAYVLIPDTALPGNSSGFTTSPVNISGLNSSTYGTLRAQANFTCVGLICPTLSNWTIVGSLSNSQPTLTIPFDNAAIPAVTPYFQFASVNTFSNPLSYEIQVDPSSGFNSQQTITKFNYYAGSTNAFEFMVFNASHVLQYESPSITPPSTGLQSYTPSSPVSYGTGWYIGVYNFTTGVVTYNTGPGGVVFNSASGSGNLTIGSTGTFSGNVTRQYSMNGEHYGTVVIGTPSASIVTGTLSTSTNSYLEDRGYPASATGQPFIDSLSASYPGFSDVSSTTDADPFGSGNQVSYSVQSGNTLTNNTTYWWRVRATDPTGSNVYSAWSSPQSFTVNNALTATTWFQTTASQFSEDTLFQVATSGTDDVRLAGANTSGIIYSPLITYAEGASINPWGSVSWTNTQTAGSIFYHVEYFTSTSSWALIPNSALPNNSVGTTTGSIALGSLSTSTYNTIRLRGNFTFTTGTPILSDWTVNWSSGLTVSGTAKAFDQTTNLTSGTVAIAVNGVLQAEKTGTISGGVWSISDISAPTNSIVTVFIMSTTSSARAVGVTKYNGSGSITGMKLYQMHLTLGSNATTTLTNADVGQFDNSVSGFSAIFDKVDASNNLNVCATTGCTNARLLILPATTFEPAIAGGVTVSTGNIQIDGTLIADGNTISVGNSWKNDATFTAGASTVIFTATSTAETVNSSVSTSTTSFFNVTFGSGASTATWTLSNALAASGTVAINNGTLVQGTNAIALGGNLSIGTSGIFSKGAATSTFMGSATSTWSDLSSGQDMGLVAISAGKTVQLGATVEATNITIASTGALDSSTSNYNANILGNWTNNGSYIARAGTVTFIATTTGKVIAPGVSNFYNITFNGTGGNWSFSTSSVTATNNFLVTAGTVTLPTGTTTIGGNFDGSGGIFQHNNGTVLFNGSGTDTIHQGTSAFYNATFNGSSNWSFLDTNATTSHNMIVTAGTVTFPSGTLAVGGSFNNGGGTLLNNSGTMSFTASTASTIFLNASSAFNMLFSGSGSWVFLDTSATAAGTVTFQSGTTTLPPSTFAVGGSWSNIGGTVAANGGTVSFISTGSSNTIAAGASSFSGILFNSASGSWTFTASATSSNNTTVSAANQISFATTTSLSLAVLGVFSDTLSSPGTNFANGTLFLNSGTSYTINTKSTGLNTYGTLLIGSATNVRMWGSSAATTSLFSTGSLYSMNHANVSGALNIWGAYTRSSGSDYWDYATDFDGTALGGSSRQAIVLIAGSSTVQFTGNSTLEMLGITSASTTVASLDGGLYGFTVNNSTINAKYFALQDTNVTGLSLTGTTTISSLANGAFTLTAVGGSSITMASTVVNQNAALQIQADSFTSMFPATSTITSSSGANTFQFFDDFTGGLGQWTSEDTSGAYPQIPTGQNYVRLGGGTTVSPYGFTSLGTSPSFNSFQTGAIEFSYRVATTSIMQLAFRGNAGANTGYQGRSDQRAGGGEYFLDPPYASGAWGFLPSCTTSGGTIPGIDTWTWSTIAVGSTEFKYYYSGALMADCTDSTYSAGGELALQNHYGDHTDFDWIAVRKLVTPEPILGPWGTVSSPITGEFRKSVTINTSTSTATVAQSNYVVRMTVNYGSGTDSGSTVYCNSLCNTGFADLRFTNAAGKALPFWRQKEYATSSSAVFWVQVDSIPASPATATIYVYYGATAGYNVTETGTPTSYVWFRNSYGALQGEVYNNDPGGNPGYIRWDNSGFNITVSGHVYSDHGVTPIGSPTCNGVTANVVIVVNGASTFSGSCNAGTGAYSIANVTFTGDVPMIVYLSTTTGPRAATVTKSPNATIANLDLYQNALIVREEATESVGIPDLAAFDSSKNASVPFSASTSTNTLILQPNRELYIWPSMSFTPVGNVTLQSGGSGSALDGRLYLATSSSFIAAGGQTQSIGGGYFSASGATFNAATSSLTFTATTTGKIISTAGATTFNAVTFNGTGGGWILSNASGTATTTASTLTMTAGALSGTGDMIISTGGLSGAGTITMTGGTFQLSGTGTFGGSSPWQFNNLSFGNGATASSTETGSATSTIIGILTVATNDTLNAGSAPWVLSGGGTPFALSGTFNANAAPFSYTASGATNITSTTYANLTLAPAAAGSPTYTPLAGLQLGAAKLTIGDGTHPVTVNVTTNDPSVVTSGSLLIATSSTLIASDIGAFNVGGSWTNNGTFTPSGQTVLFNSTNTGNTINAGSSSFFNLSLNSSSGGWTFTGNATSTNDTTVSAAASINLATSTSLAVLGTFTNAVGGASTSFGAGTLFLNSGTSYTINTKTTGADTYGTLIIGASTNVRMWNSSAATTTVASNASLYSMNHGNVSGALDIWGAYTRSSGSDYWDYATDFDGTALGGSSRAVTVAIASSTSLSYSGGLLDIVGSASATTSIATQGSGTFSFSVSGGTLNANYFKLSSTTALGLNISGSTTVSSLSNGVFTLVASGTAITVASTTISVNPVSLFFNDAFATTTGVSSGTNVTEVGTPTSYWWFRSSYGSLQGEAHDIDPGGDPGYVRWDNSSYNITVSGNAYSDEGVTVSTACNNVTPNIRLVDEGGAIYTAPCNNSTGAFSIPSVAYTAGDTLTLYFATSSGKRGADVTVNPSANITGMQLYENRVIVREEQAPVISIASMSLYDSHNDSNIPFTVALGSPNTLTLAPNTKLLVWTGMTFAPGGNVTLQSGGSGTSYDGTLEVQTGATWNGVGQQSYAIGGSFLIDAGATFTAATSTTTFTATTTGKTITLSGSTLYNAVFNGTGGNWAFSSASATTTQNFTITAGTVSLPTGTLGVGGSFLNNGGIFMHNNGSVLFTATSSSATVFANGSNFYNLTVNATGALTFLDTNATTSNNFIITAGGVTLPTNSFGVGGSFTNAGTFSALSDTINFTSTSAGNTITSGGSNFYGLTFNGTGGAWALLDSNETASGNFTIVAGAVTLPTNTLSLSGSFTNAGSFVNSNGTVAFVATTTGKTINPGASSFSGILFNSASGSWTFTGNATSTNNTTLTTASSVNLATSTSLAVLGTFTNSVAGSSTNFSGGTLFLNSGTSYTINSKTAGADTYGTLIIGASTNIRMWNSGAATISVNSTGSLYSMNHAGVSGALDIWGTYSSPGSDYWDYATDFDGTALGGSSRAVTVAIATSSSVTSPTGLLDIVGTATATTTISNQGSGTYSLAVTGGTLNANYFKIRNTDTNGLNISGSPVVSSLSHGDFQLGVSGGTMISVSASVLNSSPSLSASADLFATSTGVTSGSNVAVSGTTINFWTFTGAYGNYAGEAYDNDGVTSCGNIRWDNSACQFVDEAHYRWRNDDGGEGALTSTWYNASWSGREQIVISNPNATTYTNYPILITLPSVSGMQSGFADVRFTDSSGTSTVPYWIQASNPSVSASIWVNIASLPASGSVTLYMYYGNSGATTTSSSASMFPFAEDFESNTLAAYSGDTSLFTTGTGFAYSGTYGLNAANVTGKTTNGLYRTGSLLTTGETLQYYQYVNSTQLDEACTLFGVHATAQNYALCLEEYPSGHIALSKNVTSDDVSGTVLASSTVSYSSGWYQVVINWLTTNLINVNVYNPSGGLFSTLNATDTTYSTGGMGYTFWSQHGGWDFYTARQYTPTAPTYTIAPPQANNGASWKAAEDTALSGSNGALTGQNLRLRFSIQNSSATTSGQLFRLQVAPLGSYPACESVPDTSYSDVPTASSGCGSAAACMSTSTQFTNLSATSPSLSYPAGMSFAAGAMLQSPSNQTASTTLASNTATEVEYNFQFTNNALSSTYCLRTSNAGIDFANYDHVAKALILHAPTISNISFNGASNISLVEGTTTNVTMQCTLTDLNGYTDIVSASSTIYRSGVGPTCTANQSNCYPIASSTCALSSCSGNSCTLTCTAPMQYFADPTDASSTYGLLGQHWFAQASVEDSSNLYATSTSFSDDVLTLAALEISTPSINFGALYPGSDTGTTNATTTILNTGNDPINIQVSGTSLTNGVTSIGVNQQKFATSTFQYASCSLCQVLAGTANTVNVELPQSTSTSGNPTSNIYWGLNVPNPTGTGSYNGTNTFTAVPG